MKKEFQEIKKLITASDKILIIGHQEPDGDSIGSMLALKIALQNLGKNALANCSKPIPSQFNFLPDLWQIKPPHVLNDNLDFDLIFCLDYGSPERLGLSDSLIARSKTITIDHHPYINQIGQVKLIDTESSSVCEILYKIFEDFAWSITKNMAICLLTGIITDTESFRNPNTSPDTLVVASRLLSQVGSLNKIIKYALSNDSESLKLWGQTLNKIEIDKKIGLIVMALSYQDSQKINLEEEKLSGLANFLNLIAEAKVTLTLIEKEPQKIKGSLRSKGIDVAQVAEKLGGGGHKLAAGFETEGKMEDIVKTVKNELTR